MAPLQLPGSGSDDTADKAHRWTNSAWDSSGEKTCGVCGLTETPGVTRADMEDPSGMRTGKKSRLYHYRDAAGVTMSSLIPLTSCPTYIGQMGGAVGETKQRLRGVTTRVGTVEGRVDSVEDRMTRLEEENRNLREQVDSDRADVVAFIQWLGKMTREHAQRGLPTVQMSVQNEQYMLPAPVADIIRSMGTIPRVREEILVEAEFVTEKKED